MPELSHVFFPFNSNRFLIELWESGNASDYSILYPPNVQAARGATESYTLANCPKGDPVTEIEVTGNTGSDIMKYNYIGIDYGTTGDGKKWYFVKGKTILNYPKPVEEGGQNWYAIRFSLELDYWETYKQKLGSPMINLQQVTTNDPAGWEDTTALEQDILPFSPTNVSTTSLIYRNWKTIVGWQAKKPSTQENFVIDGMSTTLQFNDNGDLSDYLEGLDELANGELSETYIFHTYIACNTYVVSEYFTTKDGTYSKSETLELPNPKSPEIHNRLNYYPYKRAFVRTVDGQNVEIDYHMFSDNKLPETIKAYVFHSTVPSPTSTIFVSGGSTPLYVVFSNYPSMDIVGKNITPVTQLFSDIKEKLGNINSDFGTSYYAQKGIANGG